MVRAVHKLFKLNRINLWKTLPKPYLDYYEESKAPAQRVHDPPPETMYLDYNQDEESGYIYRVPDHPIHVTYPPQSQYALWGNTGCVAGFEKPKKLKPRWTRLWVPKLEKHTFYSDILDIYINTIVSLQTLELIDECKGFDFYILKTKTQDLRSELGRKLKHKMLVALTKPGLSPYVKEKYKDFIRPMSEVEWYSLSESEAITKVKLMRIEETIDPPLRLTYANELIRELSSIEKKSDVA